MRIALAVLAAVVLSASASAQDTTSARSAEVRVGSRVRLGVTGQAGKLVGTVAAIERDTMRVLGTDGRTETPVSLSTLASLEQSTGVHRHVWKSAGIGAAIGAGIGIIAGLSMGNDDPQETFISFTAGEKAMMLGAMLGGAGLLTGAIVGAASPHEDWKPVVLPLRTAWRGQRSRMGIGIGLSFALR